MGAEDSDVTGAQVPKPQHKAKNSASQNPDSPVRADSFKRMSTASITTPLSTSSSRPVSMITTYTDEPFDPSPPASRKSLSLDTNPYLTAVAAQERRVLELREELHKAEAELQVLKKNWAQQEANKKRTEIRQNAEAMRPLASPIKSAGLGINMSDASRQSIDEERKRAFHARPRIPDRRVFEGRHTRTLSLLSPGTLANRAPSPSEPDDPEIKTPKTAALPPRSTDGASEEPKPAGRPHAGSTAATEDIVNTGKQLVGDIREGLWSFWDDLRQATVGDEALKEPPLRRPSQQSGRAGLVRTDSSNTLQQPPSRRASRSPHARSKTIAAPTAIGPHTPGRATQKVRHIGTTLEGDIVRTDVDDDGGWSNWDSPAARAAASAANAPNTNKSPVSTPRTSVSSTEGDTNLKLEAQAHQSTKPSKALSASEQELMGGPTPDSPAKDSIPWPALKKFRPASLQRTASNLMKEWERSLTPPAEEAEKDWIDRYIDGPRQPKNKDRNTASN